MTWQQLEVTTRHPDFAEEILLSGGALSVSQQDAADDPVLEPGPGETPLWPRTRTIGLFHETVPLESTIDALRTTLPDGTAASIRRGRLDDDDWSRAWMRDWHPQSFGDRLWICPEGQAVDDAAAVVVALDPGLAFGTGTHPSTALCLRWLDAAELEGRRVLDYGCGSGILAIAALRLGAERATGIDIDPQARAASRANASRNGVADRLAVPDHADAPLESFDIVLANILAGPLVTLAPRLGAATRAGGHLVLAGLLERQADTVCAAYRQAFHLDIPATQDGWACVHGLRF